MKKPIDLSIIIGTYSSKELIRKTLRSIYQHTKRITFEIVLIDDASTDETYNDIRALFPKIIVLRNTKNLGYSKTYNKGTKLAKGRYILHLNSDVLFTKNSQLWRMIAFLDDHTEVGVAGCKVLKHNHQLDLPCRHAVPTIKNVFFQTFGLYTLFPFVKGLNYYMTYTNENRTTEVGGVLGAFMLIRRKTWKDVGYLDERFYMYCEDTDYCYRAIQSGWKVYYYPHIAIMHIHGGTTRQFRFKAVYLFHKGMAHYYRKHYAHQHITIANACVYTGIFFRFLLFVGVESVQYLTTQVASGIRRYYLLLSLD